MKDLTKGFYLTEDKRQKPLEIKCQAGRWSNDWTSLLKSASI
jgi:hypothetical protein